MDVLGFVRQLSLKFLRVLVRIGVLKLDKTVWNSLHVVCRSSDVKAVKKVAFCVNSVHSFSCVINIADRMPRDSFDIIY